MQDPLDLRLQACQYTEAALAAIPEHDTLDELVTKRIFARAEPPRWLILLHGGTASCSTAVNGMRSVCCASTYTTFSAAASPQR